ncbi:MAG: prepilin-type N-terminal cleavage/methylation domain-containing protein [Oscillibacter sp.]|nr:prepilin-type N-terminal cleavage/methylation domain-containing protein [Oscillibacter sp.]
MKKFWKKSEGFTLVELIVVIAILGILAGVGTVGYSGYIKKANMAADEQLLATVNQAFAMACLEAGKDASSLTTAVLELKEDQTVDYVSKKYDDAFKKYYSGNELSAFKVFKDFYFDAGRFVQAVTSTYDYNGEEIELSENYIQAMKESAWGDIGAEGMLTLMESVSGLGSDLLDGEDGNPTFEEMMGSPEFAVAALEVLGKDGETFEDLQNTLFAMAEAEADKYEFENLDARNEFLGQLGSRILTNTVIMVSAKNSAAAAEDVLDIMTQNGGKDAKESFKKAMVGDNPGEGLAQASIAYGLYTAYMSKDENFDASAPLDFSLVMNAFEEEGFQDYLNDKDGSGQVQKDLAGYLAGVNTISGNSTLANDVLINGFNYDPIETLLKNISEK